MRSHGLHAALRAFVEEAAGHLAEETAAGAEVPFELVEQGGGRRTPLYCYRPLVGEFLRERDGALARLPGYGPALRALGEHVDALGRYQGARGRAPTGSPPATLQAFLAAVFHESTEFVVDETRFARAYEQLEEVLFAGRVDATVLVPLLGIDIASDEVPLGEGLSLRRGETVPGAPGEALGEDNVLAVYRAAVEHGSPDPFVSAGRRFRRLLTALRLYDDGGVALGPLAWTRIDDGPWRAAVLGTGGLARGLLLIEPEDEDELRAFVSLISRRMPRSGELSWAVGRYEMACERLSAADALTDVLLALRALLDPAGSSGELLARRLSALCAVAEDRAPLAERAAHAVSLERAIVAGTAPRGAGLDALVEELAGHLRALLRDVLCGHLDSDLRAVADRVAAEETVAV